MKGKIGTKNMPTHRIITVPIHSGILAYGLNGRADEESDVDDALSKAVYRTAPRKRRRR
jgi:hypothetical protein